VVSGYAEKGEDLLKVLATHGLLTVGCKGGGVPGEGAVGTLADASLEPMEASGAVGTEAGYESGIGGVAGVGHGKGEVDQGDEVGGVLSAVEADDRADGGNCMSRRISDCSMLTFRALL
jgi:hypothetical protein